MVTEARTVSLTVEIEKKDDKCVVVHCRGRLVAGVCSFLCDKVHGLIPDHKLIVLDLTDLEWVDSLGLGTLVRLYAGCKSAGCQLQVINLGKRVKELLGLTKSAEHFFRVRRERLHSLLTLSGFLGRLRVCAGCEWSAPGRSVRPHIHLPPRVDRGTQNSLSTCLTLDTIFPCANAHIGGPVD